MRRSGRRGSLAELIRNLRQPASVRWKVERYVANMLTRVRNRSDCCGHDGEPGC
jgi:hypothetical protein